MLNRILVLLILAVAQFRCGFDYGDTYQAPDLADGEREKRDSLQIENIVIGTRPIATWNRRTPPFDRQARRWYTRL